MKNSKEFKRAYQAKIDRFERVYRGCALTVTEEGLPAAQFGDTLSVLDYPMCRQALRYILQKQGEIKVED